MIRSIALGLILIALAAGPVFGENDDRNGIVAGSNVNLRSGPDLKAPVITRLSLGQAVTVIEYQSPWVRVELADQRQGWLYQQYMRLESEVNAVRSGREQIVSRARDFMGTRYVYGGGSGRGFDCSGFTMYIYRQLGVELPHNAAAQMGRGVPVSRDELRPGDLIFFSTMGAKHINHVGIYCGDGQFIHASSGYGAVRISPLNEGYYDSRYRGARRFLEDFPEELTDSALN